jgi:hypothetical protein
MGALCFVCPTSGREVVTQLEVGLASLATVNIHQVGCPECGHMHGIADVGAWVATGPSALGQVDHALASNMGTLRFVCPATRHEVDTGILIDPVSLEAIHREKLGCPECLDVHQISEIRVWVADKTESDPEP